MSTVVALQLLHFSFSVLCLVSIVLHFTSYKATGTESVTTCVFRRLNIGRQLFSSGRKLDDKIKLQFAFEQWNTG